jgi:hypothetical protein
LGTWAPFIYQIPRPDDVVDLAMACLKASKTAISAVPDELVRRFHLSLLPDAEADVLLEND